MCIFRTPNDTVVENITLYTLSKHQFILELRHGQCQRLAFLNADEMYPGPGPLATGRQTTLKVGVRIVRQNFSVLSRQPALEAHTNRGVIP